MSPGSVQANSNAYNYRNLNTVNYLDSLTWLTGDRDRISSRYDAVLSIN